jgi:hypothetical protein
MGDSVLIPPRPDDNDEVFIRVFSAAVRKIEGGDDYWSEHGMMNLPLLQQRLMMQQQQAAMKQQQQLLAQMAMQQAMNPKPDTKDGQQGAPAKKGNQGPPTAGNAVHSSQGPQGAMPQRQ